MTEARAKRMPIFRLTTTVDFPPTELAEPNGLLAIGGDLSPERLITAYSRGIFPWFSKGEPLLWWFTSPRLVLFPEDFHIPSRLQRYQKKAGVHCTTDQAFCEVIDNCATVREETGEGTWITESMRKAYIRLHELGVAHSVECWHGEKLVGGLYGVALGQVFFGESMFSRISCGSQYALIKLVDHLASRDFGLIDCQMTTSHLLRFGAKEVSGKRFSELLRQYITTTTSQFSA